VPQKIGFLFPGQGSQFVGMGRDLTEQFPETKELFRKVDDICQKPISSLCFEGPIEDLTLTQNLQPAITVVNLASLSVLNRSGIRADVSAGHSLGEYSALVSAGIVSEVDALRLARKRGELMHREALAHPGGMAAVVGMDWQAVSEVVAEAEGKGVIAVANHNTADQIVITGEQGSLSYAAEQVKKRGGKSIPLKVSGAWHSKLMEGAVEEFRLFMEDIPFSAPRSKIFFNGTAAEEKTPGTIKDIMSRQLVSPVRWYEIIQRMSQEGVTLFIEVGPKKVLTGLLKKIVPSDGSIRMYNVEDSQGLKVVLQDI
jgi:[acyl-carrier-protein] S-malonyltransferase